MQGSSFEYSCKRGYEIEAAHSSTESSFFLSSKLIQASCKVSKVSQTSREGFSSFHLNEESQLKEREKTKRKNATKHARNSLTLLVWGGGRRPDFIKQSRGAPHSFSFPLVLSRAQGSNSTAAGQGSR